MLTWLTNPNGDLYSTADSPSTLNYSFWNDSTWSAPALIASSLVGVSGHAAALQGNEAFVILPRNSDPSGSGNGVLDLYSWNGTSWTSASTFANGDADNRIPTALYDSNGVGHVMWLRGKDLVHATLTDPVPQIVRAKSTSVAFYDMKLLSNPQGNLSLLWMQVGDNGPANLYAMIYDPKSGMWSADRRLNEDTSLMHDASGYYGSDGQIHLAYLATEIQRGTYNATIEGTRVTIPNIPQDGRTDLRLLDHSLITDLAVTNQDLAISPQRPQPGVSVTATLTVHNAGDFPVGSFLVNLYAGNPDSNGVLLGSVGVNGPFAAGDQRVLSFPFVYPASGGDIVAVVDPANDVSEFTKTNNQATVDLTTPPPDARVMASVTSGNAPLTVNFDGTGSYDYAGGTLTHSWAFADGSPSANGATVSHTFTQPGSYPVTLAVVDENGAVGTAMVTITVAGTRSGNTQVNLTLPNGGANTTTTVGSTGPVQAGFVKVTINSGNPPYGTAVFSLTQNGVVVSEAGVPVSPPTTQSRLFIDYRNNVPAKTGHNASGVISVNTGVAVVNPGTTAANVTYTLRDKSGQAIATGQGVVSPNGHFAKFIDQLNQVAAGFVFPSSFASQTQFGTLDISSDQPLSVLALRLTTNQRDETLLSSTPVADLMKQSNSNAPLYFPRLADGGGYRTTLALLNTSIRPQSGNLYFYAGEGAALTVNLANGGSGTSFPYYIPVGGAFIFQTSGLGTDISTGSVQVIPDITSVTPAGAEIISYSPGGTLVSETGVPSATPTTHARIYIDKSGGHDTGLAIADPGNTPLNVTLTAFQNDGSTVIGNGPSTFTINPKGNRADFVGNFISGIPNGFTGVMDISCPTPFVALTLRALYNARGDFLMTTFPIADLNQPAPTPIIFPQVADGSGGGQYQTQIILLSTGNAVDTTLNYYGDDGSPLAIGKTGGR